MRRIGLSLLILAFAGVLGLPGFGSGRAAAIEVTCIEASKYKHLYKIFGGDPRKFAAYLQIDPGRLPGPEHCRAALITGKIEPPAAQDAAKLADIIVQNEGWLATLHLSSTGGSVGSGYQLGFLARNFWLKTTTARVAGANFQYTPGFFRAAARRRHRAGRNRKHGSRAVRRTNPGTHAGGRSRARLAGLSRRAA